MADIFHLNELRTTTTSGNTTERITRKQVLTIQELLSDNHEMSLILVPVVIYVAVLMVSGIIGNIIVCYIYFFRWRSKTVKYFIGSLALYDLITCLMCMPMEIAMLRNPLILNDPILCKCLRFTRSVTSLSAGFMLVIIAVDRYFRVCKHTRSQIQVSFAKKLCVITAVAGLFVSWPTLLIFGSIDRDNSSFAETSCSVDKSVKHTIYPNIYYGGIFLIFFGISACLVSFYTLIGAKLCRMPKVNNRRLSISLPVTERSGTSSNDSFGEDSSTNFKKERSNSTCLRKNELPLKRKSFIERHRDSFKTVGPRALQRRRTTITLFLITMIQWVSVFPYFTVLICKSFIPNFVENMSTGEQVAFNIGILSHFFSSGINPFIYGFFSKDFRDECKKTWVSMGTKNSKTTSK